MEITHELMLDLQQTGVRQTIYAKRCDSLTRTAKIRLFDGGTEFTVPPGVILQIAYAKSDGKGGLYDTMPDNSRACTASGNIVTAKLHPQMFTVAGLAACELRLLTGDGEQLSTFTWFIAVQSSATDGIKSEDYYNYATLNGVKQDIGDISKLTTTVKTSLVDAINSVYSSVKTISNRYITGVNGKQRDASGNVEIKSSDINTEVQEIQYQGTVEGALAAIANLLFSSDTYQAAVMRRIAEVAAGMADGDTVGVPIINSTDGIVGDVSSAWIVRSAEENASPPADGSVKLPTEGRVAELIRKDVTADYAAWTPESGTQKTVENYAKTLPDGKYYIIHGGTVYMDIFTVYGDVKYRFIRQYDDDACYMELFRGDQLTISVEDDVSSVMLYGRKMLMDWNIPLPTAADVGKVLTASAVNRAAWTEVTNAEEVAV